MELRLCKREPDENKGFRLCLPHGLDDIILTAAAYVNPSPHGRSSGAFEDFIDVAVTSCSWFGVGIQGRSNETRAKTEITGFLGAIPPRALLLRLNFFHGWQGMSSRRFFGL